LPREWRRRRLIGIAGAGDCRWESFGLQSPGGPGLLQRGFAQI